MRTFTCRSIYLSLWGQSFGFFFTILSVLLLPSSLPFSSYPLFYSSSVALPLYNPSFFHPSSLQPFLCPSLFLPYSISIFPLFHFTLSLYSLYSLPSYPSQPFLFPSFLLRTLPLSILPSQNPSSFSPYFFHSFSFTLPLYRPPFLNPSSFSSSTFHPFLLTPFLWNTPFLCFSHCL